MFTNLRNKIKLKAILDESRVYADGGQPDNPVTCYVSRELYANITAEGFTVASFMKYPNEIPKILETAKKGTIVLWSNATPETPSSKIVHLPYARLN